MAEFVNPDGPNPSGLCECGCGEITSRAPQTKAAEGIRKGQYRRYIRGHKPTPPWPVRERIERQIERTDSCWIWRGGLDADGYGQFAWGGKCWRAHRAVYTILRGEIPAGLQLDHLCRVRNCVNPDHLEPVTPRVNTMRSLAPSAFNAVKTHCIRGHEFTSENTRVYNGRRICVPCARMRSSQWVSANA